MGFLSRKKEANVSVINTRPEQQETEQYPPVEQEYPPVEQPRNEFKFIALITEAIMESEGIYKYVVETNYPLSIGNCKLEN